MSAGSGISGRKVDHLEIVMSGGGRSGEIETGFDQVRFVHCALPEINLDDVDISTAFLGKRLRAPLLISSMTGGPARAATINLRLAEAAQARGIALAVGSQRIALETGDAAGFDRSLRTAAPDVPIYANFGAAQLGLGYGLAQAQRAIDMIEADALIVHLNPLQEAVQTGFGLAEAVKGGGVEVAHAKVPGAGQGGVGVIGADRAVKAADRGGAEAQFGEMEGTFVLPVPEPCLQLPSPPVGG